LWGAGPSRRTRRLEEKTLKTKPVRERLMASSMICGAALVGLAATQAYAADAETSGEVSEVETR